MFVCAEIEAAGVDGGEAARVNGSLGYSRCREQGSFAAVYVFVALALVGVICVVLIIAT